MTDRAEAAGSADTVQPVPGKMDRIAAVIPGAVLVAIGSGGLWVNRNLEFGSAARMGEGYFPIYVSALILVLGMGTLIHDGVVATPPTDAATEKTPWRAIILVGFGILGFALLLETLGMFLSTFGLLVATGMAAPNYRAIESIVFSLGLAALVVVIFSWGLGVYVPVLPF